MRVALMPSAFAPAIGGVEELTYQLARSLTLLGHQVEVWASTADPGNTFRPPDDAPFAVRRTPMPLPPASFVAVAQAVPGAVRALVQLRGWARDFGPDVVHVQCFGPNGAYATALCQLLGLPLVVTSQGETVMDDHNIYERSVQLRWWLRRGIRKSSATTACSDFVLEDLRNRFGLANGQVIPNAVDIEATSPEGLACAHEYIVAVGRVVEKKGFDLLVNAFRRVHESRPSLRLHIGGSGPAMPALRRLVEALGLERSVKFLGPLTRDEVAVAMSGARAVVVPSRVEPFGIVALEAWRSGSPVVVTNVGGTKEFVEHGVSGLVVDPSDSVALADAILELLDDDALAKGLAANGRERVLAFGWSAVAGRYESLYEGVRSARAS